MSEVGDVRSKRPVAPVAPVARKVLERAFRVGHRFVQGLIDHDAFGAAASIAFWIFLSLVPLLVLLGFLVGQVARARGVDALVGPVLDLVPGAAEGLVSKELQRLAGADASVAPVGVVGFLWTASAGFHNLMDVFEAAVRVKRRPWWKQRAIALAWVLLGLAVACALAWVLVRADALMNTYDRAAPAPSASAAPAAGPARPTGPHSPVAKGPAEARGAAESRAAESRAAESRAAESKAAAESWHSRSNLRRRVHKALTTPVERLVAGALLLLAGAAFLAGFYRFAVEHPPGVRRRTWPGAIAAIVSFLAVSSVFGEYAVSIADYALYYGSLAAVAVLLVWLYFSSLALVVGAEVNAQLEGLRDD